MHMPSNPCLLLTICFLTGKCLGTKSSCEISSGLFNLQKETFTVMIRSTDAENAQEASLHCRLNVTRYRFQSSTTLPGSPPTFLGEEWKIFISGFRIPVTGTYKLIIEEWPQLNGSQAFSQLLNESDLHAYHERNKTFRGLTMVVDHFRKCQNDCVTFKRPATPEIRISLKTSDDTGMIVSQQICQNTSDHLAESFERSFFEAVNDQPERGDVNVEIHGLQPEDSASFSLKILQPANKSVFVSGNVNVRYRLVRQERRSPCEVSHLVVFLNGYFYLAIEEASSICDTTKSINLDFIPRGNHVAELVAVDREHNILAKAPFTFSHLGPSFFQDENALCLLSYSQSGNHLIRFVIEYLTKQPTHGCPYNIMDPPIYLNRFPGKNPLSEVNPYAPPAAYKFHYSGETQLKCSWTEQDGKTKCKRLVFLIRDFAQCIPRFFEGSRTTPTLSLMKEQIGLYLENVEAFATFDGPKHLVHYEDLLHNPSAIQKLATFLGADLQRAHSFNTKREELMTQSKMGQGRVWMGVRSSNSSRISSYLTSMNQSLVCYLTDQISHSLQDPEKPTMARKVLRKYARTMQALLSACQYVKDPVL